MDAKTCEVLFDQTIEGTELLSSGVKLYRTKTTWAGSVCYVECYPIWDTKTAQRAKEAEQRLKSSEAQRAINRRNAQRKLEQKVNANFGDGDLFIVLTYTDQGQPTDEHQAKRDMQNYIKRIKTMRKRLEIEEPLKYIYVTECTHSEKKGTRYHHHIVMSGQGMNRDDVEKLWTKGIVNSRRCKTQDAHLSGLANYMSKSKETQEKASRRSWNASKNLTEPKTTVADHKISTRKIERIAAALETDGRGIMENAYKGYRLLDDIVIRASKFVSGAYVYARLIKTDVQERRKRRSARKEFSKWT